MHPFELTSVVGDELVIDHMLGSADLVTYLYSPEGEWVLPSYVRYQGSLRVVVGFKYLAHTPGVWRVIIGAKAKSAGLGMTGFVKEFGEGDLTSSSIIVNHGLGSINVMCSVYANTTSWFDPLRISVVDADNVKISFLYGEPLPGIWKAVIVASTLNKGNIKGFGMSFTKDDLMNETLLIYHNLGTRDIILQVYDGANEEFLPTDIRPLSNSTALLYLNDIPDGFGTMTLSLLAVN